MRYLYGDSMMSPLTSNVLEYLRDALDFCVYALGTNERIQEGRARMKASRERADADIEELEAFGRTILEAITATPKRAPDAPAVGCADAMTEACSDAVRASVESVRERLRREIAQAESEEAGERDGCVTALMALLVPHEPPNSSAVVRRVRLRESREGYEASMTGECDPLALRWKLALGFPAEHLFATTARVDRVLSSFELHAPELTGWLKKEVKVRPQRIEHLTFTEVVQEGSKVVVRLRPDLEASAGFDVEADVDSGRVTATRIVSGDGPDGGRFDVDERQVPRLLELCKSVTGKLTDSTPAKLVEATFGGEEVRGLDSFVGIVEQMIGQLAPIVHEIAAHSLEPTELVLRRQLGDDRREEIYVSRETLRAKYRGLPEHLCGLFAPLGLEASIARSIVPSQSSSTAPRAELAPSRPPPPPAKPASAIALPKAPGVPGDVFEDVSDAEILLASVPPAAPPVNASPALPASLRQPSDTQGNEALVAALKKAVAFGKAGKLEDSYREYAVLFGNPAFGEHRPDDQRRALKVMVMAKPLGAPEAVRDAHRAALSNARALATQSADAADYELVGLCELVVGEQAAANETFKKALELARTTNPSSELCGRLMKRVAEGA